MTIDWNAPLELTDGTPVEFLSRGITMSSDGGTVTDYWVATEERQYCLNANGRNDSGIQVRNRINITLEDEITPEEAIIANLAVECCLNPDGTPKYNSAHGYACAIAAIRILKSMEK